MARRISFRLDLGRLTLDLGRLTRKGRRPPRRKGGDLEREPVEPDKPSLLSGGAAAELEFDE